MPEVVVNTMYCAANLESAKWKANLKFGQINECFGVGVRATVDTNQPIRVNCPGRKRNAAGFRRPGV